MELTKWEAELIDHVLLDHEIELTPGMDIFAVAELHVRRHSFNDDHDLNDLRPNCEVGMEEWLKING